MSAVVEVYARAASVELLVNGKSVGKKTLKNTCRAVFKTAYEDGEVTAVSYDAAGAEIGRYTLTTAGVETELQVKPETETVKPDGLAFIPLQYTDSKGIWKPMEKHTLTVEVENGTLAGLGSANAYVDGNYAQDTTPTYYGEAMAVVRAGEHGPVRVTVTDETGCHTVEIPCQE
jgi:beta-galactosidase